MDFTAKPTLRPQRRSTWSIFLNCGLSIMCCFFSDSILLFTSCLKPSYADVRKLCLAHGSQKRRRNEPFLVCGFPSSTLLGWQLSRVASLSPPVPPSWHQTGPSQWDGRGGGRPGEGTDWRGSRGPGGEKLSKQDGGPSSSQLQLPCTVRRAQLSTDPFWLVALQP